MHKFLVVALVLAVGCKGGDKCERLYDKMAAAKDKENDKDKDKDKDKKDDAAKREKSIAQCHEDIKDPKMAKMTDCMLALDDFTKDKAIACMDLGDDDKKMKKHDKGGADNAAALAKLGEFADQMCACKDADCAKKVNDDMTAWSKEMMDKGPPKLTDDETKQASEKSKMMGDCAAKAMAAPATP